MRSDSHEATATDLSCPRGPYLLRQDYGKDDRLISVPNQQPGGRVCGNAWPIVERINPALALNADCEATNCGIWASDILIAKTLYLIEYRCHRGNFSTVRGSKTRLRTADTQHKSELQG